MELEIIQGFAEQFKASVKDFKASHKVTSTQYQGQLIAAAGGSPLVLHTAYIEYEEEAAKPTAQDKPKAKF